VGTDAGAPAAPVQYNGSVYVGEKYDGNLVTDGDIEIAEIYNYALSASEG